MSQLSHCYNEWGIFTNIIYGLIVSVFGAAVLFAVVFAAVFGLIVTAISQASDFPSIGLVLAAIAVLVVSAVVIGLVTALFYKRDFDKISQKSGVGSFDTAGLLILIGAIVPFVAGVGWIFAAVGFNALDRP